MDFKVQDTRGDHALQMDIKINGISKAIMEQALAQAREARMQISMFMDTPSPSHVRTSHVRSGIFTIRINKDKDRKVIGPAGKMIARIIERTGCKIDVEDDGASISLGHESRAQGDEIFKEITATQIYLASDVIVDLPCPRLLRARWVASIIRSSRA